MPLDDLVRVIETLQQRIRDHGDSLRQNEIRTRVALIDPLLKALGWDVADPGLVTAEYDVSGRRADYALLGTGNIPAATVEAKKLNESLEPHRLQMLNYSNAAGIRFAGLTDGNKWEFYEIFKQGTLDERRLLEAVISSESSAHLALRFLLLWRPNLGTGQAVRAENPAISVDDEIEHKDYVVPTPPTQLIDASYTSLTELPTVRGTPPPSTIRLPTGDERKLTFWWQVLFETANWLASTGKLTPSQCPVQLGNQTKKYIVNVKAVHPDGQSFYSSKQLSNGLFCEASVSARTAVRQSRSLLAWVGVDPASVHLKLN